MTPELRKQMEEMAEKYAHMGIGKHSETEKIRRYNGYATGFTACSEIYEAKLDELNAEERKLTKQITECLAFFIWLKEYEYTDGTIHERLEDVLKSLVKIGELE